MPGQAKGVFWELLSVVGQQRLIRLLPAYTVTWESIYCRNHECLLEREK